MTAHQANFNKFLSVYPQLMNLIHTGKEGETFEAISQLSGMAR
jgi:hypothetical protein